MTKHEAKLWLTDKYYRRKYLWIHGVSMSEVMIDIARLIGCDDCQFNFKENDGDNFSVRK